jgi:SAM-dependent MidA family methyltransferase
LDPVRAKLALEGLLEMELRISTLTFFDAGAGRGGVVERIVRVFSDVFVRRRVTLVEVARSLESDQHKTLRRKDLREERSRSSLAVVTT